MTLPKDYTCCPPKKRAIALWSAQPEKYEVDENEMPQDLSLKTRQRLKDSCSTPELKSFHSLILNEEPTSNDLISKSSQIVFPVKYLPLHNEAYSSDTKSSEGNDGLRYISNVSSRSEGRRPSVLRAPIRASITHSVQKENVHGTSTSYTPSRIVLGERGTWSYHPYLPLAYYGLPASLTPKQTPLPLLCQTPKVSDKVVRSGSVSPPGDITTETSESEGSPELRGEKLSCPDCGRGYATVAGLSRHQQFHCLRDASKTFFCNHCPKTYTSMGALKMHIRTHTLPCKCYVCGKAFSRPWLLQGHIRTHTGEKPFECQQCHRSFADRSNLRAHLQTHAEIKKYGCQTCPKTFSRMSLLVKHQDHGCPGVTKHGSFSQLSNI